MAKDPEEEKKKKARKKAGKKKLDIAAIAVIDNMVFSKTEQWAYYRISNTVYDFLSMDAKVSVASQLVNAFANLLGERQEPLDCHLMVASTPVDIDAWEEQIREVSTDWDKSPGFDNYIAEQAMYLKQEEYLKKVTILGVNLGKRGALNIDALSFFEKGVKGAMETTKTWLDSALQLPTEEIPAAEEDEARKKEEEIFRTLSTGNFDAVRCTTEELLLILKRTLYPAMPTPYLSVDPDNRIGPGDLELEMASAIKNNLRFLEMTQMYGEHELTGYRATLTISKLPKRLVFPESMPFMYLMHKLGLPFTTYARFSLRPNEKMRKTLEKKKKEQKDELDNLAGAGAGNLDAQMGSMPAAVAEAVQDIQELSELLNSDKLPWVEGVYRIVVETGTEESLKKFIVQLKQRFSDQGIVVQWSVGDQANLLLEQMPGDRIRETSNTHVTDLKYLGTARI